MNGKDDEDIIICSSVPSLKSSKNISSVENIILKRIEIHSNEKKPFLNPFPKIQQLMDMQTLLE